MTSDYFSDDFWDFLKPLPIDLIQDHTLDELYLWFIINTSVQQGKTEFTIDGFHYKVQGVGQGIKVRKENRNPITDEEILAIEQWAME